MSTLIGITRITETVGMSITSDIYGLDTLTRPFTGPVSDWARWRGLLTQNSQDRQFADYYLTGISAGSQRGEIINPVLTYKGVPGLSTGKFAVSAANKTGSLESKTLTLKLSDGSGRTLELEYLSPTTTWTYATGFEPTESMHAGEMLEFDAAYRITKTRGATQYPVEFVNLSTNTFQIQAKYFCYVSIVNRIEKKQAGKAWEVTERNEGTLVAVEDINSGKAKKETKGANAT